MGIYSRSTHGFLDLNGIFLGFSWDLLRVVTWDVEFHGIFAEISVISPDGFCKLGDLKFSSNGLVFR